MVVGCAKVIERFAISHIHRFIELFELSNQVDLDVTSDKVIVTGID